MKHLMMAAILSSILGCSRENKAIQLKEIGNQQDFAEIKEFCNFVVSIRKCPTFLEDMDEVKFVFKMACKNAHFGNLDLITEYISKEVSVFNIYGEHGYAALYVDTGDSSCALEFFCYDDTYSYPDFIASFMIPFNIISDPESFEYGETDLLN